MLTFIQRERLYILMVLFIVAMNIMPFTSKKIMEQKEIKEKKAISTMTFEDIGVTEGKLKDFLESKTVSASFFRYTIVLGFCIFVMSIILNLRFIFQKAWDKKWIPWIFNITGKTNIVLWGILDLIRVSIIVVFTGYILAILEGIILKISGINVGLNLRMMINTFFIDIGIGIVVFYFVTVKYKGGLKALGLRFESLFKNILSGLRVYFYILPLLCITLIVSIWLSNLIGYTASPQPVFEIFIEEKNSKMLLFFTVFVSIFGPIIEEIFFRGFMYSAIKKHIGVIKAGFLTSAIFSVMHTNIVGFIPILTLGMVLVYLYEKTGSLVAPMALHIVHNSIIVGFVIFIKHLL